MVFTGRSAANVGRSLLQMQTSPQSSIELPGIKKLRSGKVREVFDLGDTLLFIVTDRISAFDVILPTRFCTRARSSIKFLRFGSSASTRSRIILLRRISKSSRRELQPFREQLAGRSMIVRKTTPLAVECVVRGYLAGSGWKEYQESQSVWNARRVSISSGWLKRPAHTISN